MAIPSKQATSQPKTNNILALAETITRLRVLRHSSNSWRKWRPSQQGQKKTATNWRKTKQNESEMWMWMKIKWIELKWKSTWRKLFFNFRLLSGCFYLFFPYVPTHSLHIVGPLLNTKRGEFRHKISPRLSIRSSPFVRHFTCTCLSLFSFVLFWKKTLRCQENLIKFRQIYNKKQWKNPYNKS